MRLFKSTLRYLNYKITKKLIRTAQFLCVYGDCCDKLEEALEHERIGHGYLRYMKNRGHEC